MLYHLQHHHREEIDDSKYQEYLDASFRAGEEVFDKRLQEYDQFRTSDIWSSEGVMDGKIAEWREQMRKAIYGEITKLEPDKTARPLEKTPEKPLENPLLYLEIIGDASPKQKPEKTKSTNNNALLIGLIAGGTIGAEASLLCVSALAISVVSVPAIAIVATSVVVGAGIGIAIANNSCKSSSASQISTQTTQQIPG